MITTSAVLHVLDAVFRVTLLEDPVLSVADVKYIRVFASFGLLVNHPFLCPLLFS